MFNTPPFPTDPEATIGFRLGVLLVEPGTGEISGPAGREQVDPKVMAVLFGQYLAVPLHHPTAHRHPTPVVRRSGLTT